MVRIKRERKRKLFILAAAGVLTVAALVVLIIIAVFFVNRHRSSDGKSSEDLSQAALTGDVTGNTPEGSGVDNSPVSEKPGNVDNSDENTGDGNISDENAADGDVPAGNAADIDAREDSPDEDAKDEDAVEDEASGLIDDDSLQDMNSVVESELKDTENEKRVYLTFDDGPSVYTDEILDILDKYDVKATFFVCGTGDRVESLRHVYKRIADEGHTIGMHSYSHVYGSVYGNLDLFQYDLDKIRNLIYNETGVVPKYYRFPGGSGNTIASLPMSQYISVLYSQGMEYYDWNVYGGDSSGNRLTPSRIVENTLEGVDRRNTAVVLLHDTGSRRNTVLALPEIIEGLKERGLLICPIDEDTPPLHQFDENKQGG